MNKGLLHTLVFIVVILVMSCSKEPQIDYSSKIEGSYQYVRLDYYSSLSRNLKTQTDVTLTRINHNTLKMNLSSTIETFDVTSKKIETIFSTTTLTNVKANSYTNFSIDETAESNISVYSKPRKYNLKGEGNINNNKLQLSLVATDASDNSSETTVIEFNKK